MVGFPDLSLSHAAEQLHQLHVQQQQTAEHQFSTYHVISGTQGKLDLFFFLTPDALFDASYIMSPHLLLHNIAYE